MNEADNAIINEGKHTDVEKARIEQLLTYMADCQQGIRDLNTHIQTLLTVISTLLALVFGYSVISEEKIGFLFELPNDTGPLNGRFHQILNSMITVRRINFWLASAIILIGVLFITCLEIEKTLRYQYSQHLADRLHDLIPGALDDRVRNALVTYQQFAGPIKTNNLFHVSNSHNLFNFSAIYATGGLAGGICLVIVIVQFILIRDYHWYDWLTLSLIVLVILLDGILLIRFVWNTDKACDMAFYMANENLEVRKGLNKEKKLYWQADEFLEFVSYLLYPRKESLFKAYLIVGGFIAACVVGGKFHISHLVYILIVFESFLYQARYHINDLRGLDEDKRYTQKRLVNYVDPAKPSRIIVAIGFAIVRIVMAAVFIYFLGGSIRNDLFWFTLALFVASFSYEKLSTKDYGRWTIALSGAGFPMRVAAGALAADRDVIIMCLKHYPVLFAAITILLWLWGDSIALLGWIRDIDRLERSGIHTTGIPFPKAHYNIIYPYIQDRLKKLKESNNDNSIAGEKGCISDPWCLLYWGSLILLLGVWFWNVSIMNDYYLDLSILELPAILMAARVVIHDYDKMKKNTIWCLFLSTMAIGFCKIRGYSMEGIIVCNLLLVSMVLSVCILRNRKMVIHIPIPFKSLAIMLFGDKAVQMLSNSEKSEN